MDDSDLYRLFKTLHVIAVVLLGGGFVLEGICGPLVARARTVQEVRVYARLMTISENILSPAAALGIFLFGYATISPGNFSLGETWLLLGQILFYAIAALAIVILRPAANKLHRLAQEAPAGPVTPEISAQLKQPLPAIIGATTSVMFVFVIYLMVSKPHW